MRIPRNCAFLVGTLMFFASGTLRAQSMPGCEEPYSFFFTVSLLTLNPSCDIVSPDTGAERAAALDKLRGLFPACYATIAQSPELQIRIANITKEATADEENHQIVRDQCDRSFGKNFAELLEVLKEEGIVPKEQ